MTIDYAWQRLEGKTIASAADSGEDKGQSITLTFTDGTHCEVYALGYDGLWDDVYIDWPKS